MDLEKLLQKMIDVNPKFTEKYEGVMKKWWSAPEDDFLLSDFGYRIYTGIAILLWFFGSIGILFTVINALSSNQSSLVGWIIFSVIFTLSGFLMILKGFNYRRIYKVKLQQYNDATKIKLQIDKKIKKCFNETEEDISLTLKEDLNTHSSFPALLSSMENLIEKGKNAQKEINSTYGKNRIYEYNINEKVEIDAYASVDSFKCYEEYMDRLGKIITALREAKKSAYEEDDKGFKKAIEQLIVLLPNMDNI